MTHWISVSALMVMFVGACHPPASILLAQDATELAQDATEIVRRADQKTRGRSSRSETTITIIRPTYTRELSMVMWSLGDDYFMILITAPSRDEGTTFLKRGKEIWNWLPSIERTIKLPPSMMSQNWMGTDFTNDDLVEQSSLIVDYTHEIVRNDTLDGYPTWVIELIPKEDAAVVWGRVLVWVDKEHYMMLRTEFFDEDDELVNTMVGSQVADFDGVTLPGVLEMIPADEEGHRTVLTTHSLEFDIDVSESFFTVRNMKSVRADE